MVGPFFFGGEVGPGGTQAFGDRAAAEVEDGRGERARGRDGAAPPVALPVEERVLDDVVAEVRAEGRREEVQQRVESRPHERLRAARPSRFSATAVALFSRRVSSASARRPWAVSV